MNNFRVLAVDDEFEVLSAIKMRLEANNYEVILAVDGLEALYKARNNKVDLIILDLMLPKMDGYKVCRMLKFDKKYKHIPIIMFTARDKESDLKLGAEVGANAYLTKTLGSEVLLSKIEELIKI